MITNERQYKITKGEVSKFKAALQDFKELELVRQGIDPVIVTAQRNSLEQQLKDLEQELLEYEKLRSGSVKRLFPTSITDIGQKLVEARIAQNLSQRALAERLGMKEQQIQRYEQDRYLTANLNRVATVAEALHLDLIAFFDSRVNTVIDKIAPNLRGSFDISRLPFKEMKARGWLDRVDLPQNLTGTLSDLELAAAFVSRAVDAHALHRQHVRTGSKQDEYALIAWKAQILSEAGRVATTLDPLNTFDGQAIVSKLISLSVRKSGPLEAVRLLQDHGVILVLAKHLPATHLDGAAMLLDGKIPVIGLTLRHDRLDNFWFTLLHELGHIFLHKDRGLKDGFFDTEGAPALDELEKEADEFAESAFVPKEIWKRSFVRFTRDRDQVIQFAKGHGISSAVVAGRIRRERGDFSLFSDLVGSGSLRKLMATAGYWED